MGHHQRRGGHQAEDHPKAMLVAIGALAASQALFAVAMGLTLDHGQRATAYPQLLCGGHYR